jgi:predicted XRE-type DNA-binding protein
MPQTKTPTGSRKRAATKTSSAGSARKAAATTKTAISAPVMAFQRGSGNVFADIGVPDADERLAKAELARIVRRVIRGRIEQEDWTQARAAKALGIAAGDMSNLMRGKLTGFSQERLEHFLLRLDMEVRIQVAPRPAAKRHAEITVEEVAAFA